MSMFTIFSLCDIQEVLYTSKALKSQRLMIRHSLGAIEPVEFNKTAYLLNSIKRHCDYRRTLAHRLIMIRKLSFHAFSA